jgi:hypothetical protein
MCIAVAMLKAVNDKPNASGGDSSQLGSGRNQKTSDGDSLEINAGFWNVY